MTALRVLIVDDEPLARQRVRDLLAGEPDVEIAGEAEDGVEAIAQIASLRPDILFLDVQMAGLDGFEVIEAFAQDQRPIVIFTTAHDHYAVRAFEENAVDYLLKPLDGERLREALRRARAAAASGREGWSRRVERLLERLDRGSSILRRVVVREDDRVLFIDVREVDWFEAAGNYVRVHRGREAYLVRMTMHVLERRLDGRMFARIHRSTIVNAGRVRELQPIGRGEYDVVLTDGTRLDMQRAYQDRLRAALGDF